MRPTPLLVCLALLLGVVPASAGAVCAGPEEPPITYDVPTLSVTSAAGRPSYRGGERAFVTSRVRTAAGTKVEGAEVTVELSRAGRVLLRLHEQTPASGDVRMTFRAPVSGKGPLDAFTTARLTLVPSYDCRASLVYQYGEQRAPALTTVR